MFRRVSKRKINLFFVIVAVRKTLIIYVCNKSVSIKLMKHYNIKKKNAVRSVCHVVRVLYMLH